MRPSLPQPLIDVPLAHRGLHGLRPGCVENAISSFEAAIAAGYGIELDVQLSADGCAMVFHDKSLERMTGASGLVVEKTCNELGQICLNNARDTIPTLEAVLGLVAGRVPVLIEVKDQDGDYGPNVGRLEEAVAHCVKGYDGPVAVMSFNPHSVAALGMLVPQVARGLTTYDARNDADVSPAVAARLADIADYDAVGASFISHDASDLRRHRVQDLKAQGARVLCWTVRSPEEEAAARRIAENITFEGYLAPMSG